MTLKELIDSCHHFEPVRGAVEPGVLSDFASVVHHALAILGMTHGDLADSFEVAESTISRWASGISKPLPHLQRRVVASIAKRGRKMVAAVDAGRFAMPVGESGTSTESERRRTAPAAG